MYDLVAVPSLWLETGPLVVLEAFAAGIPVLGSRLGGIAELVRHGVDGWLAEAGDVRAWQRALRHLVNDPSLLTTLRQGIQPVRTTRDVASETLNLYERVLAQW